MNNSSLPLTFESVEDPEKPAADFDLLEAACAYILDKAYPPKIRNE